MLWHRHAQHDLLKNHFPLLDFSFLLLPKQLPLHFIFGHDTHPSASLLVAT